MEKSVDVLPINIKNIKGIDLYSSPFMLGFHGIGSPMGKIKRLSERACFSIEYGISLTQD